MANLRGTSTNLDPNYLFSLFVPTITLAFDDGSVVNTLEVFSPKMIKAIKSMQRIGFERYKGTAITTLAFKRYQTTTIWWMIMLASQQLHALTIDNGDIIAYPNVANIRNSLNKITTGSARIPSFVTI
jgi:hypothetical protein